MPYEIEFDLWTDGIVFYPDPALSTVGGLSEARGVFDLNGDAIPDYLSVSGDWPTGEVLTTADIYYQDEQGRFAGTLAVPEPELSFPGRVLVEDFNNDGLPDIYVATFGNEHDPPSAPDVLYLRQSDGTYLADTRTELPLSWSHGTSAGDLNNDGWIDVFSTGNGGGASHVFWGGPNGFTVEISELTQAYDFNSEIPDGSVRWGARISDIRDFDGNGHSDLFLGRMVWNWSEVTGDELPLPNSQAIIIYDFGLPSERTIALPDAQFSSSEGTFPEDWETMDAEPADLDRDGDLDLVLYHQQRGGVIVDGRFYASYIAEELGIPVDESFSGSIVQVLENRGGTWVDRTDDAAMGNVTSHPQAAGYGIQIVDLNFDGLPDIAVERDAPGPEIPYLLLNDGVFGFSSLRLPERMEGALLPTFGDLNMDGVPDLAAAGPRADLEVPHAQLLVNYGIGEADVWYGTANRDTVRLSLQNEAHGEAGHDWLVGNDQANQLYGGFGNDQLDGGGGNDLLAGHNGNDLLNGGSGTDTAQLTGDQSSYTLSISQNSMRVLDRRDIGDGTDTLTSIEFLDFNGSAGEPLSMNQFGGTAGLSADDFEDFIELYIALFNRAPDALGLNFWGTAFANGTTLREMTTLFFDQDETRALYPENFTNAEFVERVYENVLGREYDQGGFDFWVPVLDDESNEIGRDTFIFEFLRGVQPSTADEVFLQTKVDIGAYFAVHKGMSDVENASAAMVLFDGTQNGVNQAVNAIDNFYQQALDPITGEFLMQIVGVLDNQFDLA